jgi:hypothetical protein
MGERGVKQTDMHIACTRLPAPGINAMFRRLCSWGKLELPSVAYVVAQTGSNHFTISITTIENGGL